MGVDHEFVLERVFDFEREKVWRAWSEAKFIEKWYGPNVKSIVHEIDVKAGGHWLHEMQMGEHVSFQRADYLEVSAPQKLVFTQSSTDENWKITGNEMMPDWPKTLLTSVTLEAAGEKTLMKFVWQPHEASEKEMAAFAAASGNFGRGWEMGMDLMDKLLAEM